MPIATPSRKWSFAYHESHILTWRFTKRQVGMPYECWLLQAAGNCWEQLTGRANATSSGRWSSGWKWRTTRSMSCFGSTRIRVITIPKKKGCNFVGGESSPLLANLYLHYVLDLWAAQWRRRHAQGEVILVRYCDDFIVGFQHRDDAEQFLSDLRERFQRFRLELHPEKTRLIECGRWASERRQRRGQGQPETFDFLGLTHMGGTTKRGEFTVRRCPIAKRLRKKLQVVKQTLRERLHGPIAKLGAWRTRVVVGH